MQCSSRLRRCHKSDMLLMAGRQASFFIVLFFISQLFRENASQQCGAGGDLYSIYQMMLKGHTYKSFKTAPGTPGCREACLADVRCQSYNVVMFIAICELNNRTKEARPEDFVKNKDRYYMAKGPKRGDRKCKDLKAVLQLRRGGEGKGGREVRGVGGRHSTDSSLCERNLKCTQCDARHCLTHIFTEVSIDCQL